MIDRASLLRRAGAGAAGLSLAELLGAAGAVAGGGGDFPDHPHWRFVFVSHNTLDPLFVATQFGAQDAAALVGCSMQWTGSPRGSAEETMRTLRSMVSKKADGIAVSIVDDRLFAPAVDAARRARIPLVAFNVGPSGSPRPAYVGENAHVSGSRVGAEIARLVPLGEVVIFAPAESHTWTERRLQAVLGALARLAKAPSAAIVRLGGDVKQQQHKVEAALAARPRAHGAFAVDGLGTLAVGRALAKRGRAAIRAGGYDLLPNDLKLVADGTLDFVVDQQPYVQGFVPMLQLFLARISEGTVAPWDTETSILLRKADVQALIRTKSRFEGSTSRHEFPLRRG
jgi:simple sugar transport system substrate-binding protein